MSEKGKELASSHNGKLRIEWQNGRLIVTDGVTNLALFGMRDDGSIGWDIAPTGVEVTTADLADLVASDRTRAFTIAVTDTVSVTRAASTDSGHVDVNTGSLGAPMFLCTVRLPASSPSFRFQTPHISLMTSGTDSGKVTGQRRALYDPTTGVIRFFVDATSINSNYASSETWEFQYFLLYQNIP